MTQPAAQQSPTRRKRPSRRKRSAQKNRKDSEVGPGTHDMKVSNRSRIPRTVLKQDDLAKSRGQVS